MSFTQIRTSLREPLLRSFILGIFCSSIGTWAQRIAIGWLVFELTGSAAWVGAVATAEALPALIIGPFAGSLADRHSRVRIFAFGQIAALCQAALLVVLAAMGWLSVWVFVGAALTLGVIDGFNQPTRLSLISNVASRELRATAVALNSFSFNAARFIGPAIGGAALVLGGPVAAFGFNVVSFLPLIGFLVMLLRRGAEVAEPSRAQETGGVRAGVIYAVSHAVIGPIFFMLISVSLLARPIVELLPAISGIWFDSQPDTLATLTALVGLGAMAGGVAMTQSTRNSTLLATVLWAPGGLVLVNLLIALGDGLPLITYPLLTLAGTLVVSCGIGAQTVIHMTVDAAYLGRVLALYGLIQRAVTAIGAFLIGAMTDIIGLRLSLVIGAVLAGMGWLALWLRRARLQAALAETERQALEEG